MREEKTYLVTVVMTALNERASIGAAIESILSQTMHDFELLIIDDGSTDSTGDIARSFSDPRIRVIRHERPKGISASRNEGILASCSKYIAIFDADDVSRKDRLEKQVAYMEAHPAVALCGSWGIMKSELGSNEFRQPVSSAEIKAAILKTNPVVNSSMMARAEILKEYLYDSSLKRHEDYDLCLRIALKYDLYNIPEPLIEYETSFSLKYRFAETLWKMRVRWRAFYRYGYPLIKAYWVLVPIIIFIIPTALKWRLKKVITLPK
jgi:glycosyltransferase involved in cell wall biosynthesis